jgi:hypothetical protein
MSFQKYQLVNLLRHAEQEGSEALRAELESFSLPIEAELRNENLGFTEKVSSRAQQLTDLMGLRARYEKFSRRTRSLALVLYLIMAGLGFFAVMQTLSSASMQLNIYWLLLVLLGFNALSMFIWIGAMLRSRFEQNIGVRTPSPLMRLYRSVLTFLNRGADVQPLLSSWGEIHFFGEVGKWFTSRTLHAAWLMYLSGGLLALVISLSGKQYDFIWGTTILSTDSFVQTTQYLATIPAYFGFTVPTSAQVILSQQGADLQGIDLYGLRSAWASFLFSSILIYALLPRLILWGMTCTVLLRRQSSYRPDWDLPYFYRLRSRLLPQSSSLGVVDADEQNGFTPPSNKSLDRLTEIPALDNLQLPSPARYAAFEWGHRTPPSISESNPPEIVNDAQAQHSLLSSLQQRPLPLVLMVPLERAADRGAGRFFKQISAYTDLTLLIVRNLPQKSDAARWAGWQALAERLDLPQDHLILVDES